MSLRTKLYVAAAAAALILLSAMSAALWSNRRFAKLESEASNARSAAAQTEHQAREQERLSAEYKKKIEYLEESLSAVRSIAEKQDAEIKKLISNTNTARNDVDRARAARSVAVTNAELCRKLAELGHPCE